MKMQFRKMFLASLLSMSILVSGVLVYADVTQQNKSSVIEKYRLSYDLPDKYKG